MKFVVSRSELGNLVRKIQSVVPQTAPLPILSHVLIEARGSELICTATDLTVGARCSSPAKVYEEGAISIPSRRFFQLIRELTDSSIELTTTTNGSRAEIKTGTSRFVLHGMDKEDYPALPDLSRADKFKISSETLKDLLQRTSFAVSKEDNRYVLTGVLMKIEKSKVLFVGTDGKRLAQTEASIEIAADYRGEYILPLKAVDELSKMLGESAETTIYLTEEKVAFESGSTLLVTKLLSGNYPDFSGLLASKGSVTLNLHREEMITLLRQVSLFTTEGSLSVRFTFADAELVLTANSAEIGEGKVSMAVNYEGPKLEVAFNPHYFLDILRHSKDETVTLGLSDAYNPGIITDSTASLFIIMPMRLGDAT